MAQIAAQGNLDAKESIALEEKRQAKATLAKEKELRKQKTIEMSLAMIKTYTAILEATKDPAKAAGSTVKYGALLSGIINSLPSFFGGTENTSRGNLDSKGGFLSVLHPNERVVPAEQNKHLNGIANSDLPSVVSIYRDVMSMPKIKPNTVDKDDTLVRKLDELNASIKEIQVPHNTMDFDNISNTLTKISKYKGRTDREERRGDLW